MQVRINAASDPMAERVEKVLHYYLSELDERLESLDIEVGPSRDALRMPLFRCDVYAVPLRGEGLFVHETQGDLVLAITRALDRTARAVRRRQAIRQLRRSA
jgi:hypothetical protein